MPDVITVISSDCVMRGRNGRMVSGASVWPMKMLAATFSDSAPLARMHRLITTANSRTIDLHHAEVIEHREQRGDEDDRRQNLEREDHRVLAAFGAERAVHDLRPDRDVAERAEHEPRALDRVRPAAAGSVAEPLETPAMPTSVFSDDQRKQELQAEAPADRSRRLIARRLVESAVREAEDADQPDQRLEPTSGWSTAILHVSRRTNICLAAVVYPAHRRVGALRRAPCRRSTAACVASAERRRSSRDSSL